MAMKQSTIDKYELVIDEWFINGFNGTKAYQDIYPKSTDVTADAEFRRILGIPRLQEYAQSKRECISELKKFSHESLVNDLLEIKERCMQKAPVMKFDPESKSMVQAQDEEGNNLWVFDANAAIKTIVELGKHDGDFYEKNNKDKAGTSLSPEERAERIKKLKERNNS